MLCVLFFFSWQSELLLFSLFFSCTQYYIRVFLLVLVNVFLFFVSLDSVGCLFQRLFLLL